MPTKIPKLHVDAASYYFAMGYLKAPEKCSFATARAGQCVQDVVQKERPPSGWLDVNIQNRSDMEVSYRMTAFRDGVLYSSVKHKITAPKIFDNLAVERVKENLSFQNRQKKGVPGNPQKEYDRLLKALHDMEDSLIKAADEQREYRETATLQQRKSPEYLKKLENYEREVEKKGRECEALRHQLWGFLARVSPNVRLVLKS